MSSCLSTSSRTTLTDNISSSHVQQLPESVTENKQTNKQTIEDDFREQDSFELGRDMIDKVIHSIMNTDSAPYQTATTTTTSDLNRAPSGWQQYY
jgi:hypothetical protein